MKKIILALVLILYIISFTPKEKSIYVDKKPVRILSIHGPNTMYESDFIQFIKATINTAFLDIPCHYGNFINIITNNAGSKRNFYENNLGTRLIRFSFRTVLPKPEETTTGWVIGTILGWLIRVGLLIYLFFKLKKQLKFVKK